MSLGTTSASSGDFKAESNQEGSEVATNNMAQATYEDQLMG